MQHKQSENYYITSRRFFASIYQRRTDYFVKK